MEQDCDVLHIEALQATLAQYVLSSKDHDATRTRLMQQYRVCQRNEALAESVRAFEDVHGGNAAVPQRPQGLTPLPPRPTTAQSMSLRRTTGSEAPVCAELSRLKAYEAQLRAQLDAAEREAKEQHDRYAALEADYEQRIFQLAAQRRSKRSCASVPAIVSNLQVKRDKIVRFCRASAGRREAAERMVMGGHDRGLWRCDCRVGPVNDVAVVVTGSVPADVSEQVVRHVGELGGVLLPHTTLVLTVFPSICSAYMWLRRVQNTVQGCGWGAATLQEYGGVPQLSFGMSFGSATTVLTDPVPYSHKPVALAIRCERAARAGEVVLCPSAASEMDSFRRSIHVPLFSDCIIASYSEGTCLAFRTTHPRPRPFEAHTRQPTVLERHAALLECNRMSIEDQHLAVKAPTGTVTIVFTDIQSSVQLWEAHPVAMKAAHEIHNSILRSLLDLHNGYEVKNEGDAFMVAFGDVCDAKDWCMNLQLKLVEATWPAEITTARNNEDMVLDGVTLFHGLRVRMGLTTGEPDCTVDPVTGRMDYFGPMVNLAARISGQGKGGDSIVGSDAMAALRQKHGLPSPDVVVTGKGTKTLKGISKNETMFQLFPRTLARRKEVAGKGEKKKNIWGNILSAKPKNLRLVLDPAKQAHLLRMEKRAPKIFQRARRLLRLQEKREREFMHARDTLNMEVPPLGRVTLAFTDIQSSTLIWDSVPDVMERVLADHNTLLRRTIKEHDGYEVKTEGDAFLVAFRNPRAALEWCMASQAALLQHTWPEALDSIPECSKVWAGGTLLFSGPRVRMGFNTGEPMCEVDTTSNRMDYLGPIVNNAARVSSRGCGGEVVVGHDAFSELLTLDDESDGAAFCDIHTESMGHVQLKGISKPESLYSMVPDALRGRRDYWKAAAQAGSHPSVPVMEVDAAARIHTAAYVGPALTQQDRQVLGMHSTMMEYVAGIERLAALPFHDLRAQDVARLFDSIHIVVKSVGLFAKLILDTGSDECWIQAVEETLGKLLMCQSSVTGWDQFMAPSQHRERTRSLKQAVNMVCTFQRKASSRQDSRRVSVSRPLPQLEGARRGSSSATRTGPRARRASMADRRMSDAEGAGSRRGSLPPPEVAGGRRRSMSTTARVRVGKSSLPFSAV